MPRHANIPIFIPHEGCPNACVFCNQHTITSTDGGAARDICPEIDTALATYHGAKEHIQIAFFGGSFTGIDRALMVGLLEKAYRYVKDGKVDSIRLSTRPDYIDQDILSVLKEYGVKSIELGIQSMSDRVLAASGRGHTSSMSEKACEQIVSNGFELVGQMMLGLPESNLADELMTARHICEMGAVGARIYPTVVFENTVLCEMAKDKRYKPLTVEKAVLRGSEVYREFVKREVRVLRIGLQDSEALHGSGVYAGANHSALGERIVGEYYFKEICRHLPTFAKLPCILDILCAPGEESKVAGQKKINTQRLLSLFEKRAMPVKHIRIRANKAVKPNTVRISLTPARI